MCIVASSRGSLEKRDFFGRPGGSHELRSVPLTSIKKARACCSTASRRDFEKQRKLLGSLAEEMQPVDQLGSIRFSTFQMERAMMAV